MKLTLLLKTSQEEQKYNKVINIELDYGIFKPKRKKERIIKIEWKNRIHILKDSEIEYLKVEK